MRKVLILSCFSFLSLMSCSENNDREIDPVIPQTQVQPEPTTCGNGVLEKHENCDGTIFRYTTECKPYGFSDGKMRCTSSCELDFSGCVDAPVIQEPQTQQPSVCGNGVREGEEECDSTHPVALCSVKGSYTKGQVYCTKECTFDFSQCSNDIDEPVNQPSVCGNGIREDGEECDTIYSLGDCSQYGDFNKGKVSCTKDCFVDLSACEKENESPNIPTPPEVNPPETQKPECGNGVKEEGEECDDGNKIDTDLCTNSCKIAVCGDGILSQNEECDMDKFTITSCSSYNSNFDLGSLKCTSSCKIDTSECAISPKCGDGQINSSSEECDGSAGIHKCTDIYDQANGYVTCSYCKLDYSNCIEICLTKREFKDGKYSSLSFTFHKIKEKTKTYIVMDNKIGVLVDDTTLQWVYSSEGDEGYYAYFSVGKCDCNSCSIAFENKSYLYKNDVKFVLSKEYTYSEPIITKVPTYNIPSITVSENLRTGTLDYQSCIHKQCKDKEEHYLKIDSNNIDIHAKDLNYNFSLIKDLGDGVYLVRYESGSSLPMEFQKSGVTNPYAVIKIKRSEKYRICDMFDNQDYIIQHLSWSPYRDTAIAHADFSSTLLYVYKPVIKDTNRYCRKEKKDSSYLWFLSYSDDGKIIGYNQHKVGIEIYNQHGNYTSSGAGTKFNYCYYKESNKEKEVYEAFTTPDIYEEGVSGKEYGEVYRSLYRDDTLIIDSLENESLWVNYNYPVFLYSILEFYSNFTKKEDYGKIFFEIVFSDPSDIDTIYNCSSNIGYNSHGYCEIGSWNTVIIKSKKIKFCRVIENTKERICDNVIFGVSEHIQGTKKPKECKPMYQ